MSGRPRRNHSAAFRAKVALDALGDGKTIAEIVQKHDVRPNQVTELHLELPFAGSRMLRELTINRANQVWAMDITCIPMARGFVYLAAYLDFYNARRPHSAYGGQLPDVVYFNSLPQARAAA